MTTLALDTCVLTDREFMRWAISEPAVKLVISPIVYIERRRQLLDNGKDPNDLEDLLKSCRIEVTRFDKKSAALAADYMSLQTSVCPTCGKLDWADTVIMACISSPQAQLVTYNIRDFQQFGQDEWVITPETAKEMYSQWS